jgi:hypothetical protein
MTDLTSIFYYVPQDNDSSEDYNAFPVFKSIEEVRLSDITESFPLPGEYHFRFLASLSGHKTLVWLDLNNESCELPQVDGKIRVKALRLSWHAEKPVHEGVRKAHSEIIKGDNGLGSLTNKQGHVSGGMRSQLDDIFAGSSVQQQPPKSS